MHRRYRSARRYEGEARRCARPIAAPYLTGVEQSHVTDARRSAQGGALPGFFCAMFSCRTAVAEIGDADFEEISDPYFFDSFLSRGKR
ncbi:hypothetical protein [Burkholderia multivorans]|uniref:hypothetical protein n=1 Tax=Burkholderia multivorans TaxID=87883 RepID=UPI0011B23ADE|nr:hypothetical protein [Burkholderia multivorans]